RRARMRGLYLGNPAPSRRTTRRKEGRWPLMARKITESVTLENVRIMFRNFEGREQTYNKAGDRNFCIALTQDIAEAMKQDGWNVKQAKPREEDDAPQDYIQAKLGYGGKGRPPRVVIITSRGRNTLSK